LLHSSLGGCCFSLKQQYERAIMTSVAVAAADDMAAADALLIRLGLLIMLLLL